MGRRPINIKVYIKKRALLYALKEEFYKVAGKAGARFGKSEEINERGEGIRQYWLNVTGQIHQAIEQIEYVAQQENIHQLEVTFRMADPDFQEFLKDEFAAMAARMSKDAWREYNPAVRQTILEEGPFIATRMRDQVVEYTQPSLFGPITVTPETQQAANKLKSVVDASDKIESVELTVG